MLKKIKGRVIVILILAITVVILTGLLACMKIQKITVEGNVQYTDAQIEKFIFGSRWDKNVAVLWLKTKLGKTKSIPFIEKYDVEIESFNTVKITIYEKSIVGYIDYMGTYMYFDKDGIVVESSDKKIDGVPKITGINFDYILLYEPLPVDNTSVFNLILTVTQTLKKYKLEVKNIYISSDREITLYINKVKVILGTDKDLSEKISDLSDLAPKLKDYSGTMDMTVLDTEGKGYTLKRDSDKSSKNQEKSKK